METISAHLGALAGQNIFLAYLIIYLATIFIGGLAAFTSLWLSFEGVLGPWGTPLTLLTLLCAAVSGDLLWYSMGRFLRTTRFGSWIRRRIPNHQKLELHIARNGRRWVAVSKFVYGSFPIIFTVGWMNLRFKTFFQNSLVAISLWLPIMLGISYGLYSGLTPLETAVSDVRTVEALFLGALILFVLIQFVLLKIFNRVLGRGGEPTEDED